MCTPRTENLTRHFEVYDAAPGPSRQQCGVCWAKWYCLPTFGGPSGLLCGPDGRDPLHRRAPGSPAPSPRRTMPAVVEQQLTARGQGRLGAAGQVSDRPAAGERGEQARQAERPAGSAGIAGRDSRVQPSTRVGNGGGGDGERRPSLWRPGGAGGGAPWRP